MDSLGMQRLALCIFVMCIGRSLHAQTPSMLLTSGPGTFEIADAVAGAPPQADVDAAGRITVIAVRNSTRVLIHLESPLPSGVTLRVSVEAPFGALTMGDVTVGSTPQDVLSAIPAGTYTGLVVTYMFSAQTNAGIVPLSSSNIVFTIMDGSP